MGICGTCGRPVDSHTRVNSPRLNSLPKGGSVIFSRFDLGIAYYCPPENGDPFRLHDSPIYQEEPCSVCGTPWKSHNLMMQTFEMREKHTSGMTFV